MILVIFSLKKIEQSSVIDNFLQFYYRFIPFIFNFGNSIIVKGKSNTIIRIVLTIFVVL